MGALRMSHLTLSIWEYRLWVGMLDQTLFIPRPEFSMIFFGTFLNGKVQWFFLSNSEEWLPIFWSGGYKHCTHLCKIINLIFELRRRQPCLVSTVKIIHFRMKTGVKIIPTLFKNCSTLKSDVSLWEILLSLLLHN